MPDFTIRSITLRLCNLELTSCNHYSTGETDPPLYSVVVSVTVGPDGAIGWGEWLPTSLIYPEGKVGRSPLDEWNAALATAEQLIGRDARDLNCWAQETVPADLESEEANGLLDGFDFALHDGVARQAGWSVQQLLGGGKREVEGMPLLYLNPPDETAEFAARLNAEGGYRWFKLKPSCDLERDVETMARIREAIPVAPRFLIDPNYALDGQSPEQVAAYLNALHTEGLVICEDPVSFHAGYWRELAALTPVKLMADERARSVAQVRTVGEERAAKFVNIHANWAGGFQRGLKRAAFASHLRMEATVGSVRYLGIGTAAYQTFASFLPGIGLCEQVNDDPYVKECVVKQRYTVEGGKIPISPSSGLGIEIDLEKLESLTLRHVTLA